MPLIQITLVGTTPSAATVRHLQCETTRLMAEVLHKKAPLTVVSVASQPAGSASAGGEPAMAAWMTATITAGSNRDDEKAAFIGQAHRLLAAALDVSGESVLAPIYVALHELPAADWGYDGLSQAARRQAAGALS